MSKKLLSMKNIRFFNYNVIFLICLNGCMHDKHKMTTEFTKFKEYSIVVDESIDSYCIPLKPNTLIMDEELISTFNEIVNKIKVSGKKNIKITFINNTSNINLGKQTLLLKQFKRFMLEAGFGVTQIKLNFQSKNDESEMPYGVKMEALGYESKPVEASVWDEAIGDIDTEKDMPSFGATMASNLEQMIANPGHLVNPPECEFSESKSSIAAMLSGASSSGGSSGGSSSSSGSSTAM